MSLRAAQRRPSAGAFGFTVLELMIVIAIFGMSATLIYRGTRTGAALVNDANEITAIARRASSLAVEHGEMYRLVLDLDKQVYVIEVCHGATTIMRNEQLRPDAEATQRAVDKGRAKFQNMGSAAASALAADPEDATKRALAIAGHHIADRTCQPATDSMTGDFNTKKGWARALSAAHGVKFKEVWVQHRDDSLTKGQVAVYFFPTGSAEKAVIELGNEDDTFSLLIYGLTGRVKLLDGVLRDVNDHMLKNALGDKDARREDSK